MLAKAAADGFYRSPDWQRDYPEIQVPMIKDLLQNPAEVKLLPAYLPFKHAQRATEQSQRPKIPL